MARPITRHLETAQSAILSGVFHAVSDDVTAALGGDRPLTPAQVNAAMREADRSLDALFGRFPDDRSAVLYRLIRQSVDVARLAPLNDAVRAWMGVLPAKVADALDEEAQS